MMPGRRLLPIARPSGLEVDRAHIVGASMGGIIARLVALRYPGLVEKLTLIMTSAGAAVGSAEARQLAPPKETAIANMISKTRWAETRTSAVDGYVSAWRSYNGSAFGFDDAWVRSCGEATYDRAYDPDGVARHLGALRSGPFISAEQAAITCPVTVIHGSEDPILGPVHAKMIVQRISQAQLDIVEGLGHEMPHEVWPRLYDHIAP